MKRVKIAILSNVMVGLLGQKLKRCCEVYLPEGYNTWVQEVLNPGSGLYRYAPEAVTVLLDTTEFRNQNRENILETITLWKQTVSELAVHFQTAPLFVSTIDIRGSRIRAVSERSHALELENDWYQFVQGLSEWHNNVYCFGLAELIADIGRKQFYDEKLWYISGMPYSRNGLAHICEEIQNLLQSAFDEKKKIIALDLDNTLWGGVIGEDGMEGIELSDHKEGQRFYDFQSALLEMKERGALLSIVSKNNQEDAEKAIEEHPAMLLRKKDFVDIKINWANKASNLTEIAADINLTGTAFVFIDDNPVERETVRGECPEVSVPDFPKDSSQLREFAEKLYVEYFRPLRLLKEDFKKTQMYQAETNRRMERNRSLSLEDYIAKLEMRVDIHRMRKDELERVVQLCSKTNQFNMTTKRYTAAEIAALSAEPGNMIFVTYARDKYGDSGLISVIILLREAEAINIDTFLMSCRVMGRNLEQVIFNEIADMCKEKSSTLHASYIATAKNKPVADLYEKLGFTVTGRKNSGKQYALDLAEYKKKSFDAYLQVHFDKGYAQGV